MLIITKTTVAARPVSVEQQIAAMVIVQQRPRLRFITDYFCWQRQRCWSNGCPNAISPKNQSIHNYHSDSSMDQVQRRHRQPRHRHQHQHQNRHRPKFSPPFIAVAAIVALALFVNCPAFVVAASKTAIRSIASGSHENDPNSLHTNWLDYQRQALRPRTTQSVASANNNYLTPDLGNIFTQLGIFIQARQRNASELAQHIFFKYFNT